MPRVWLNIKAFECTPAEAIGSALVDRLRLLLNVTPDSYDFYLAAGGHFNTDEGLLAGQSRLRESDFSLSTDLRDDGPTRIGSCAEPGAQVGPLILAEFRIDIRTEAAFVIRTIYGLLDACDKLGVKLCDGSTIIEREDVHSFVGSYPFDRTDPSDSSKPSRALSPSGLNTRLAKRRSQLLDGSI